MNLRQMEVFVAVADCGKMNLAAQKLFMTESTVSQTISKLESIYQIKLFERLNKKIYLTYEGKEFLAYVRRILALESQLAEHMKQLSGAELLRIGVSGSASFYLIHQLLAELNELAPDANITLYHYSNRHIHRLIQGGELDIAMVSNAPYQDVNLVVRPVISDRSVIVCGRKHSFWERGVIQPHELQNQPFILRENMSGTRIMLDEFLVENDIIVNTKGISNNALYCKYAVQYNPYLTCISKVCLSRKKLSKRARKR